MIDLKPFKQDPSLLMDALRWAGCLVKVKRIHCCFHTKDGQPEQRASAGLINRNGAWLYKCHGCGDEAADVIRVVAKASGLTDEDVIKRLESTGELFDGKHPIPRPTTPPPKAAIPYGDFERETDQFITAADKPWLKQVAVDLGVNTNALNLYKVGKADFWDRDENDNWKNFPCISIPMYDTMLRICGIRYRAMDGKKSSRKGSQSGIFVPTPSPFKSVLWISEGCTDPLALASLGLWSIGLPAALQGIDIAVAYCQKHYPKAVVVTEDNNRAGKSSVNLLCQTLAKIVPSVKSIKPPDGSEDVRGWVKEKREAGVGDVMIKSDLLSVALATMATKKKG